MVSRSIPGPAWGAQVVGACPVHRKVAGSVPSESISLGCGFDPPLGHVREATD